MANFLKTLGTGYRLMWEEASRKFSNRGPRVMSGVGSGLVMIGGALLARQGLKEDTRKAIEDANKALEEVRESVKTEPKKSRRMFRVAKAHIIRAYKVGRKFVKPALVTGAGIGLQTGAVGWSENLKDKAIAGSAAIAAEFAAYRAAVRAKEGDAADLKYLTGNRPDGDARKIDPETGEEYIEDDGGFRIVKDPSVFRFWLNRETCPTLWSDCRDLLLNKLDRITDNIFYIKKANGVVTLNDMRRQFNMIEPHKMDVGIGGIYGQVWDDNKTEKENWTNLHYRDDEDFVFGRTDGVWIVFDCDPEPIIGKIKPKLTQVEV